MTETLSVKFMQRYCPDIYATYDLAQLYARFNAWFFNGELPVLPLIEKVSEEGEEYQVQGRIKWDGRLKKTWGSYRMNGKGTGVIRIARRCTEQMWQVEATLLHEMCHAWLDLTGRDDGVAGHGPAFIAKALDVNSECERRGLEYRVCFYDVVITKECAEFLADLLPTAVWQFDDLDVAMAVRSVFDGAFDESYEFAL